MNGVLQDLGYAARSLRKNPLISLIAILTLALGIGANTAIFSVVNGVILRPLPYAEPDRLVMIWEQNFTRDRTQNVVSNANFLAWREASQSFEGISAFTPDRFTLTGEGDPERISGQFTTAEYFSLLRTPAAQGRVYTAEEDRPGAERVVVLSHQLWQRRFGGNDEVLGRAITLNGERFNVIGIMPEGFTFFDEASELWTPLRLDPAASHEGRYLLSFGRVRSEISPAEAQAEMDTLGRGLEQAHEYNRGWGINLVPLHEQIVGALQPDLLILFGAVGFVLLIACVNVANLLLARAMARRREMAIRSSLGAGRGRIVFQLMSESILLALLGGAIGILFALWSIDLLTALKAGEIPRLEGVRVNGAVLAFTSVLCFITGLTFGAVPALSVIRSSPNDTLRAGRGNNAAASGRHRTRNLLVVAETALAVVLLIGAGLTIRSFLHLQDVDPGFNEENLLTLRVSLPSANYPEAAQRVSFYQQLINNIEALPGVESAAASISLPFSGLAPATSFQIQGRPEPPPQDKPVADVRWVHPNYFKTMEIPLLRGRLLSKQDRINSKRVVVINETMARTMFPGEDPLGRQLMLSWDGNPVDEIVGVVADVRETGLDVPARPMTYWPHSQEPSGFMNVLVRTSVPPMSLAAAITRQVHALDPLLPAYEIKPMQALVQGSVARHQFNTVLLGLFALVALVLAAVGIYGVMAYAVTQRTREFGVRIALGARRINVTGLVVRQGMALAGAGIVLGLFTALISTRVLTSILFKVNTLDIATFGSIALLLAGVALIASYVPARRAARVQPMEALRYE